MNYRTTFFRSLACAATFALFFAPGTSFAQDGCLDGVTVDGGTIELTDDGGTDLEICAGDGVADPINVTLNDAEGDSSVWVITDADLSILDLVAAPPFDLEGAGDGTCLIWHLSYTDSIGGAAVGLRADSLTGCFALSNPITVERDGVNGGDLELADGGDTITICAGDSISDAFDVTLTDTVGTGGAWVITDTSLEILGLPAGPPFDLDNAGPGVCYVWYLAVGSSSVGGAEVGQNAADLTGCFSLSDSITVFRDTSADCATTSVAPPLADNQVKLFPNPVDNLLNLDLADLTRGATVIELTDATGRMIEQRRLQAANGRQTFDLSEEPVGVYFIRVTNDGKSLTRQVVKQ